MNWQILLPEYPSQQPEWSLEEIRSIFFKCVNWQFEETVDSINCPYHYFCESVYPGNYSPSVDILILIFTTASYLATLFITISDIARREQSCTLLKRYFLPSGPISLPIIIFMIAKGFRVNTIFPMSIAGPAILQLVHISALGFDSEAVKDLKYVILEASTISGILHASLYLDSILLPYNTGLDAMVGSSFSGQCSSCVCRKEALLVGGTLVQYRGWSATMFLVVGALFFRITCRVLGIKTGKILLLKSLLEGLGWVLVVKDCIYMSRNSLPERSLVSVSLFGGIFVLICLQLLKMVCSQIKRLHRWDRSKDVSS